MRPPGSYKLIGFHQGRRAHSDALDTGSDPFPMEMGREMRIVESLRHQIVEGRDEQDLRIRRVFDGPREIYRIEIEVPELAYLRTTLLDGDTLEELLAHDDVRNVVASTLP